MVLTPSARSVMGHAHSQRWISYFQETIPDPFFGCFHHYKDLGTWYWW